MSAHSGPGDDPLDPGVSAVVSERRQLINLTYRLLGSLVDAEDVVQETYAHWYAMSRQQQEAIEWFRRSAALNPYDPYPLMREGMCLHWLGRHDQAGPLFEKAFSLDPHSYYAHAHLGWHYTQQKQWEKAKESFEKSLALNSTHNPIATSYLKIVEDKIAHPDPGP